MTGRVSLILVLYYSRVTQFPQVERGTALKGQEIEILGLGDSIKSTLTGIGACSKSSLETLLTADAEMFHKELDRVCYEQLFRSFQSIQPFLGRSW